ncbi:magnesium transporter NIPA-domain-containing protein [Thermothelomyces heterothallicus CBS 202.75]|uniref:magnesium transporter NIPA-domain-containing protein n=1 Tax=Thermothelomyces heterothallicus CBS 202.75 TaxID=1149848 RepID=UPI00374445F7
MLEDKYIGLALAMTSSLAIGTSFVITKKGLMHAEERHGFEGDGFVYLRSPIWWAGIICLVLGEVFNFAAYAFAPAILVTPLGALSVLIGAVLGAYFLKEELGTLGKLGSAICLIGAVIIVLHAPPDEEIETVDQILNYAIQPGFLFYSLAVCIFAVVMIYKVAPIYGRRNPLIYLSICSTVGSISVMAVKAFGIALKLTFAGHNQFTHPSTYVFMIITAVCILTQMNYFNKALSQFPTNIVNPLYYVTFTTATLCASFILFKGFNTTEAVNTLSLICGFLVTFTGVYLLNLSRSDPNGTKMLARRSNGDITGTDMISSIQTRMSMEARRSHGGGVGGSRMSTGSNRDREGLIRAYDEEESAGGFGLGDLAEDTDEEGGDDPRSPMMQNFPTQRGNGHPPNGGTRAGPARLGVKRTSDSIELQNRKPGER